MRAGSIRRRCTNAPQRLRCCYQHFRLQVLMLRCDVASTVFHPHCTQLHYTIDCITLILLSLLLFAVMGNFFGPHNFIPTKISHLLSLVAFFLPLLYITVLICYWIIAKKRIPQKLFCFLFVKQANSYEYQLICTR